MSTTIGFFSDPHADPRSVAVALALFRREGVQQVYCGGDIAGYGSGLPETVELLQAAACECVVGNHDLWYLDKHRGKLPDCDRFLEELPAYLSLSLEGRSIYLVHAQPPDANRGGIKLRDKHGELMPAAVAEWSQRLSGFPHDLLLVGHTHQVYAERFGNTLLVNPGSSTYNHSCAVISLPELHVEWFALSGSPISLVWNWGVNELGRPIL